MIILDTNVLSELMKKQPDSSVIKWLDKQPSESIWITTITLLEARLGLELLPKGKRRNILEQSFLQILKQDLENRILPFDTAAANQAAKLTAKRQKEGKSIDFRDTQIAAIVQTRRAKLATRNVKHFPDLGSAVINPWDH